MSSRKYRHTSGAILLGGDTSVHQKALALVDGKPSVQRIAETLQKIFDQVVIVTDRREEYKFLGLPIYEEIVKGAGWIGAIHSALVNVSTNAAFVVSGDLANVSVAVVENIIAMRGEHDIGLMRIGGRIEPLCGLYQPTCISPLVRALLGEKTSLTEFIDSMSVMAVSPDREFLPLAKHALTPVSIEHIHEPELV